MPPGIGYGKKPVTTKPKNIKKKQTLKDRLDEAEGVKKGRMMKKDQNIGDRLDEAEPKKKIVKKMVKNKKDKKPIKK
tara:strand:- start:931 stop:1161 length:231 start_codon:yes stop_codon:yes gene_type:complete